MLSAWEIAIKLLDVWIFFFEAIKNFGHALNIYTSLALSALWGSYSRGICWGNEIVLKVSQYVYVTKLYFQIRKFKRTLLPRHHACMIRKDISFYYHMMTSSNGNIFRVTGPLCGGFTGHRWIPLTKASDEELWYFLWSVYAWINGCANNREAGELRRYRPHNDVTVMSSIHLREQTGLAYPCCALCEKLFFVLHIFQMTLKLLLFKYVFACL